MAYLERLVSSHLHHLCQVSWKIISRWCTQILGRWRALYGMWRPSCLQCGGALPCGLLKDKGGIILAWLWGRKCWSVSRSTTLVQTEISHWMYFVHSCSPEDEAYWLWRSPDFSSSATSTVWFWFRMNYNNFWWSLNLSFSAIVKLSNTLVYVYTCKTNHIPIFFCYTLCLVLLYHANMLN